MANVITIELTDGDTYRDGDYWAARHAVAVAIRHHESALRGIVRNKGGTRASTQAKRNHEDALTQLNGLMTKLVKARKEQP